jgi:hypothetical protein
MPRKTEIETLSYGWGAVDTGAESFDFKATGESETALLFDPNDELVSSYQTGGAGGGDVATGPPTGKRDVADAGLIDPEITPEVMSYELSDVLISSYQTGGSGGDDRVNETSPTGFGEFDVMI